MDSCTKYIDDIGNIIEHLGILRRYFYIPIFEIKDNKFIQKYIWTSEMAENTHNNLLKILEKLTSKQAEYCQKSEK